MNRTTRLLAILAVSGLIVPAAMAKGLSPARSKGPSAKVHASVKGHKAVGGLAKRARRAPSKPKVKNRSVGEP